jgi:hypothetical protein
VNSRVYPGQSSPRHHGHGQSGPPTDSSDGEEGMNYLRQLKVNAPEGASANVAANRGGETPASANGSDWKDRRQSPRLRCSGNVEFRTEESDLRFWGTLTDVSLHGCYVEMTTTFPAGTEVNLVLKSFGVRIQVAGTVRGSYPSLGMGICFKKIEPAERTQLRQLLDALAGHGAISNSVSAVSAQENTSKHSGLKHIAAADPKALIDRIEDFFQKNEMLSRHEFQKIAKRVRRS